MKPDPTYPGRFGLTAPVVNPGQGMLVGALFGVAAINGAQNAVIEGATQGVFDLAKQPSLAITAGARVFWDDTNRRITTTATSNYQVGIAVLTSATGDATVRVQLARAPASGAGAPL